MLPVLLTRCWPSEGAARKGRGSQEAQEQSSYKAQENLGAQEQRESAGAGRKEKLGSAGAAKKCRGN